MNDNNNLIVTRREYKNLSLTQKNFFKNRYGLPQNKSQISLKNKNIPNLKKKNIIKEENKNNKKDILNINYNEFLINKNNNKENISVNKNYPFGLNKDNTKRKSEILKIKKKKNQEKFFKFKTKSSRVNKKDINSITCFSDLNKILQNCYEKPFLLQKKKKYFKPLKKIDDFNLGFINKQEKYKKQFYYQTKRLPVRNKFNKSNTKKFYKSSRYIPGKNIFERKFF